MGSQYALCIPELDTILVTTADTQGVESAGDLIIDIFFRLISKISLNSLPEDIDAQQSLNKRIESLSLPFPIGEKTTPAAQRISAQTYVLNTNDAGIKRLRLDVNSDKCLFRYENASGEHELIFGMDSYEPQMFPEKYFGRTLGTADKHYKCIGAGAWANDNTFLGTIYSVDDYLGSINFSLTFTEDEVCGHITKAAEWFFEEYQGIISGKAERVTSAN